MLNRLIDFVDNGGRLRKNEEPKFGEPFYGEYMKQFLPLHFKPGDKVKLEQKVYDNETKTYEGIIISLDYELKLLISGRKVYKNKQNKKEIMYTFIKSIEMIEPGDETFDLSVVDPEEWEWKNNRNKDNSDLWTKKTDICKKRRLEDEKAFHKVYPDVDFNKSHVIQINDGCHLYWTFNYTDISAEVFMVIGKNKITPIPCKTGTPFPNKNSFCAYNCKIKDRYPDLYVYLPDDGTTYKDVNIVCVWTVKTPIDKTDVSIKVIGVHHMAEINPIEDENNMIFIDMHVYPLRGHGNNLFTEHSSLLETMMNRDIYYLHNIKENYVKIVKMPDDMQKEDIDDFLFMSDMAINGFHIQDALRRITGVDAVSKEKFPMVETFCTIDKKPERYYSSSWYNCRKQYQFKMLENI